MLKASILDAVDEGYIAKNPTRKVTNKRKKAKDQEKEISFNQ